MEASSINEELKQLISNKHLNNLNLSNIDLHGIDFSGCELTNVDFHKKHW